MSPRLRSLFSPIRVGVVGSVCALIWIACIALSMQQPVVMLDDARILLLRAAELKLMAERQFVHEIDLCRGRIFSTVCIESAQEKEYEKLGEVQRLVFAAHAIVGARDALTLHEETSSLPCRPRRNSPCE